MLFKTGAFTLASGRTSLWKIDCDDLTQEDWEWAAWYISERLPFREVISCPRGGDKLAEALRPMIELDKSLTLVVDDVYTTGGTIMKKMAEHPGSVGFVLFNRSQSKLPDNIHAIWSLSA